MARPQFLLILSVASWNGGDRDFLRSVLQQAGESEAAPRFHTEFLVPLFFTALNTERPDDVFPLTGTRVPYLNGGLFDPDPAALQTLNFPAELFQNLLDFFGEYNFTIDENDPEEHEVGIDPEMLGHIFENLLEDNKDKGAYYTPKAIVAYMCRQSLRHYLETHLGGENEALTRLVENHDPGDLTAKNNFCATNAKRIATLLEKVKICDPAIGSGAFPIGMLNEIVHLRTLLNAELNDPAERARLKKSIIQKSIYGVDIDSGAVDIARLRFWLALVVDEEVPEPLPNLDYKIMQGNSLLESFGGVDLSVLNDNVSPLPERAVSQIVSNQGELDLMTDNQLEFRVQAEKQQSEILAARKSYFRARKPERKAELRAKIDAEVRKHIEAALDAKLELVAIQMDQHQKIAAGELPKTRGWNVRTAPKKLATLENQHSGIEDAKSQLADLATMAERPFFLWHLLFQDVFENGGFDIVIANPPYVRHEKIKALKPLLQAEGYETYVGTADLFVYFYEQAVKLLRPGGVLTFITSNKYYRAGYGKKLRGHLTDSLTLKTLVDFRDAPVFNGVIAYASILIGQKNGTESSATPENHAARALNWDLEKPAPTIALEIQNAFPVAQSALGIDGWRLVEPKVEALLQKLRENGTPLGEYVEGRFYRGILTGCNEAFVIEGKKRAELIAADPKCDEIIKPFLRGRDVKRWQATHADLWLIKIESSANKTHPWSGADDPEQIFKETYPSVHEWFEEIRERLINRDDQGTHFWELRSCAYWEQFETPTVTYPNQCTRPEFHFDSGVALTNQKAFILSDCERSLAGFLNSKVIFFIFPFYLSPLQNDFWEPSKIFVEKFPIPPSSDSERKKLDHLVEKCETATAQRDTATLQTLEAEIDQIVYRLFDLTEAEIALIEATVA